MHQSDARSKIRTIFCYPWPIKKATNEIFINQPRSSTGEGRRLRRYGIYVSRSGNTLGKGQSLNGENLLDLCNLFIRYLMLLFL